MKLENFFFSHINWNMFWWKVFSKKYIFLLRTPENLHHCAHHLWTEWRTTANNQWYLTTKHVQDSYNKNKTQLDPVVRISAYLLVKQEWSIRAQSVIPGWTPLTFIPLCTFPEGNPIPDQFDQTETHWQMVHTASGITKSKSSAGRRHLGKCYVSKVSKV